MFNRGAVSAKYDSRQKLQFWWLCDHILKTVYDIILTVTKLNKHVCSLHTQLWKKICKNKISLPLKLALMLF